MGWLVATIVNLEASRRAKSKALDNLVEVHLASGLPVFSIVGLADTEVREARDTRYHHLVVADDDKARYLRFDSSFQSGMLLDDPFATRFLYSDYLHLGLAYTPRSEEAHV